MSEAAHIDGPPRGGGSVPPLMLLGFAARIESARLPLAYEKATQAALAELFAADGVPAQREVNLGDGDIVDFLIGDIAVEVKIKGSRLAIFRQCKRYCGHESVGALLLVTAVAMGLPETINGKPVAVAQLGRGWL